MFILLICAQCILQTALVVPKTVATRNLSTLPISLTCMVRETTRYKQQRNSLCRGDTIIAAITSFLYAFEESADWALLSSFCDDSNLHKSEFK